VRDERPPHTTGAHHRGDHHTRERLPEPLIHGAPLPLRTEQHGITQPTPADRHRLKKLTVVILG
jgi:hypothetical protein